MIMAPWFGKVRYTNRAISFSVPKGSTAHNDRFFDLADLTKLAYPRFGKSTVCAVQSILEIHNFKGVHHIS